MVMSSITQHPPAAVAGTFPSPTSVIKMAPHHTTLEPIRLDQSSKSLGGHNDAGEQRQQLQPVEQRKRKSNTNDWVCPPSAKSIRTVNPVGNVIDPIVKNIKRGCQRADKKEPISLAHGDATLSGSLSTCTSALDTVVKAALYNRQNVSYANACGTPAARYAIARHHSYPEHRISPDNVIVTNGCSGALDLALSSLLDPDTVLLVPEPGFPLYQTIAESQGASVVHYRLDPSKKWQCDLNHLAEIMSKYSSTKSVRGMVVNNPSSPTGAVFSEQHITEILDFARQHRLPIIADEVYGDLTFENNKLFPIAQISARLGRHVPIMTTSGLSKQYLLPGWRVGWLTFHDNIHGSLKEVEQGANRLAQVSHGASHLVQSVVPTLLSPANSEVIEWKNNLRHTLERQASTLCSGLADCIGLEIINKPQGAMHVMVKIDTDILDVVDDMDFASKLLEEQNVFILPGSACGVPNTFRVSFCSPDAMLKTATRRVFNFCNHHVSV